MQLTNKSIWQLMEDKFDYILIALLSLLYAPVLIHWYDGWLNKGINIEHEYFSHGLIGFPFAIYICWESRHKWQELKNVFHPLGAFLIGIAGIFYLTATPEFVNLSLPLMLVGICLWLKGFDGLKLHLFPLILVALATPNSIPYLLTPYTLLLQQFIASVAGFILMQLGFNVSVDGIYVSVDERLVEVAPYCAGLKMLFSSIYVSLMLLYWTGNLGDRQKTVLLLTSAVIVSIIANIFRNATLAYFHGTDQEAMFDWLHEGWGGDVYSTIMLGIIFLILKFLDKWNFTSKNIETVTSENEENENFEIRF